MRSLLSRPLISILACMQQSIRDGVMCACFRVFKKWKCRVVADCVKLER